MGRARVVSRLLLSAALVAPAALVSTGAATAVTVPTLVGIRASHHQTYDRVVFEFTGGVPSRHDVRYVSQLLGDASGLPVRISGRAILAVRMSPADAHTASGTATAPARVTFALPNVLTVVRAGDFEAVTTYGIGLAKREPFVVRTLHHPDRLVVDVQAAFPTVQKKVYLFNQARYLANTEPFFTPVLRPVRPATPGIGVLDRIFAGPTPAEHARGLRLLRSEATGWTDLRTDYGIARVRLTGGCSSGGSTVTVAGEIMPTLRQLSYVDHVKIYDPQGLTETPWGHSDSIPECLEP